MLPAKENDLIAYPILHVILVYLLEAGTNSGLPRLDSLDIRTQHLLQLIVLEKPKHPFLLVRV